MDTGSRPLEIDSDLTLSSSEGARIRVSSQAKRLEVDVDPSLLRLRAVRVLPARAIRREWLGRLQWFLRRGELSLAVSVRGTLIGDMDGSGTGSWSARLLGVGPIRLHPRGLLRALWARRS
jgi:hypothetical protein